MVAHRNVANRSEGEPPSISDTFTGEGCKNEPSLPVESHSVGAHKKVRFSTESNNATSQPQGNFFLSPFTCFGMPFNLVAFTVTASFVPTLINQGSNRTNTTSSNMIGY